MPSSSSLNQRFSDVIASSELEIDDNIKLNYNFALDQNYKTLNYNEIGASFNFDPIKFNLIIYKKKNILEIKNILKVKLI